MDTTQGQLLRSLRKVRHRVFLTQGVRAAGHGVLLWAMGILTYLGVCGASADRTLLVGGVGLAAAIVTALVVVVWRTPSLAGTARLLDQRLSLDERVESALEVVKDETAIASLLRTDAELHLEGVDLRQAFPFRFRLRGKKIWLVASVLAVGVLGVRWIIVPEAWLPTSVSSRAGRVSAGDSTPSRTRREAVVEPGSQGAESPSTAARVDTSRAVEPDNVSIPPGRSVPTAGGDTAKAPDNHSRTVGIEAPDRGPDRPRPGSLGMGEGGADAGGGALASGESTGQAPGERAGLDASMSGGGTVVPEDDAAPLGRSGEYGVVDWQSIENALRRERLPPGLERHVRNYFLAISKSKKQP